MDDVGIDLHRDSFKAVVVDDAGKRRHIKKYDNTRGSVSELLSECSSN